MHRCLFACIHSIVLHFHPVKYIQFMNISIRLSSIADQFHPSLSLPFISMQSENNIGIYKWLDELVTHLYCLLIRGRMSPKLRLLSTNAPRVRVHS